MAEVREICSGLDFPEGPVAMSDGSVVLVEIGRGTVTRVGPDGSSEIVAELGGGPNGAAIGPDGKLYLCNNGAAFDYVDIERAQRPGAAADELLGGRIERVDLDTGRGRRDLRRRATAARCAPRTTSSSTPTAASTSPTTASARSARATARRLLRAARRLRDRRGRSSRSTPRTGSGCRRTEADLRGRDLYRLRVVVGDRRTR